MIKKILKDLIVCILILSGIFILIKSQGEKKYISVNASDFAVLTDTSDIIILDVRTYEEHLEGCIEDTDYNIDINDDEFISDVKSLIPKGSKIAVYCRSGNRSKKAAEMLSGEGYIVYELDNGFKGWLEYKKPAIPLSVNIDRSHSGLIIFYPKYDSVDLICGTTSPSDDLNAIFCCAASFTGEELEEFKHSNIAGNHVSGGKLYKGFKYSRGCFVWYKGKWEFTDNSKAEEAINRAVQNKGMGFRQLSLILDGIKMNTASKKETIYRALCELNGKLCIAECTSTISLTEFIDKLADIGVRNALYMDMGGWSHSWYRKTKDSNITYIHYRPHDYYTNWLTFYKKSV